MVEVNLGLEAGSCTYATLLLVNCRMCLNTHPLTQNTFFKTVLWGLVASGSFSLDLKLNSLPLRPCWERTENGWRHKFHFKTLFRLIRPEIRWRLGTAAVWMQQILWNNLPYWINFNLTVSKMLKPVEILPAETMRPRKPTQNLSLH